MGSSRALGKAHVHYRAPKAAPPVAAPPPRPIPAWLEHLVRLLEDRFTVPGTDLRFGLDALLGLVPGIGDAASAAGSAGVFWLALQRGVPRVVIARMALNVAIDALLGSIPLLGDAFDFVWKANRKNLRLVERYQDSPVPKQARASDYLTMGLVGLLLIGAVALPFLVAGTLIGYLWG
ncbi:MAG: DUF4112 domain-containing protein [Myxococcales bacterium]